MGAKQYLESLYGAPWPFPEKVGIGIQLNARAVSISSLLAELRQAGCPDTHVDRVFTQLQETGESKSTISHSVDLRSFVTGITSIGIQIKIIAPHQKYVRKYNIQQLKGNEHELGIEGEVTR